MSSLQGHLLVASPKLLDPNFVKTVVLMVQHNDDGALGIVLNRTTGTTIGDIWNQISHTPCERRDKVHHGGPCEGPLMVVHGHETVSQIEVASGIHFSTDCDNVEWLMENNQDPIRFFVGCAGWAQGQLEAELKTGSWLATPATFRNIFRSNGDQWLSVTRKISRSMTFPPLEPNIVPEDPTLN